MGEQKSLNHENENKNENEKENDNSEKEKNEEEKQKEKEKEKEKKKSKSGSSSRTCKCKVSLQNNDPEKIALFKVMTTKPTRYSVNPSVGKIEPLCSKDIEIHISGSSTKELKKYLAMAVANNNIISYDINTFLQNLERIMPIEETSRNEKEKNEDERKFQEENDNDNKNNDKNESET